MSHKHNLFLRRMARKKTPGSKLIVKLARAFGVGANQLIITSDITLKEFLSTYGRQFGSVYNYKLYEVKTLGSSNNSVGKTKYKSLTHLYGMVNDSYRYDRIFMVLK